MDAADRVRALQDYAAEAARCERCALAQGRTRVVFGAGDPDADLMLVGEAPGFHEDRQGLPFVGQAGQLLDRLLETIGLTRDAVYVANVIKCRPPANRDPLPEEIAACEPHLFRQIALVEPKVVATLGNFATKLLSGRSHGITRVHGQAERVTVASRDVVLFPLFHPAAALYTPSMLEVLERDFSRLPDVLAGGVTDGAEADDEPAMLGEPSIDLDREPAEVVQLGLF